MRLLVFMTVFIAAAMQIRGQGSGNVQVVRNVSDLALRPPSTLNPGVSVLGYTTNGDWGEPRTMVYVPASVATVDNGCVFAALGGVGRWVASDCEGSAIDPRWFGAVADDLADDTTPMLAAFSAAGTRASVYIPNGRFIITSPLPLVDRVHVRGEGDGSMIAVANTNGIAFWNPTPGTRVYEVFLENFAINTALGARGHIAVSLTNVSYARLEKLFIHAYNGLGFQIGVKPWGDSPSSVGGAWSSSMVGCKVYVYPRPGEPAYAFHGDGGPDWGHGPNSWRIIDNYLNAQPVIAGGITNYGTAVVYANNQNGIQFTDNIFEGYYTNSILMEGGAASSVIGNRFEVSYGIGGTNFSAIKLVNMTNVFIAGNMSQGLGGVTKYIRSSNSSYTLFDTASESPNTIDGDLILGKTWNVDNVGYLPTVDRFLLLDSTEPLTTMGMGLRTIDSTTNNPRSIMTLNANPTNGQSWAGIWHASTPGAIPFYFYQQNQTNLAITAIGSGVLGLPTTSAALSVYGAGAFGSSPGITGGWTDMSEGVWVKTEDLADKAGFHAIINDGVTNRRIEMKVTSTNAAIITTATTAGLPLDLWVSGVNPFSVDTTGVRIKTNMFFSSGTSLFLGGDTIDDFTGTGLSVVGGKLTATAVGGGDVYAASNNVFSGTNQFLGPTSFDALNAGTLTVTNPFPASGVTNPTASRFAVFGADNRLTNDVAETGTGAPVRAVSPALTGSPTVPTAAAGTSNTVAASTKYVDDAVAAGGGSASPTTTRGDMIARGASADDRLPIGGIGAALVSNGTDPIWGDVSTVTVMEEEFFAGATPTGWATTGTITAGTGANTNHLGVFRLRYTTAAAGMYQSQTAVVLGGGKLVWDIIAKQDNLSDGTDPLVTIAGLYDSGTATNATDGVFFMAAEGLNSGNWTAVTRNNTAQTATDTGVAVSTSWTRLGCIIDNATSATFYINGAPVATNTMNLPIGAGRESGMGYITAKSTGSTERNHYLDVIRMRFFPTVGR